MITFALRGDSVDARYSLAGKEGYAAGNSNQAAVTTDEPGINGATSIDMAGTRGFHPLLFMGGKNGSSNIARSYAMRVKLTTITASNALFVHCGNPGQNIEINGITAYVDASGEIVLNVMSLVGATAAFTTTGAGLTTTGFHRIAVTWTGDNTANGLEVWVDGVRKLQTTSSQSLSPDPMTLNGQMCQGTLGVGTSSVVFSTQTSWDEFLVYDEVIDGSTYTGSASYIAVDAFDGQAPAGGGEAKIL